MNEREISPACERASDLIAFIYNELEQREAHDFQLHLRECRSCREEAASFGVVRESISAWRDEALAGFVSTPLATKTHKKSAFVALRQFFDLSPLWLQSATAIAIVMFCLLLGVFLFKSNDRPPESAKNQNPNAIYTSQDVDRMVKEALAKQEESNKTNRVTPPEKVETVKNQKPKSSQRSSSTESAKSRRPLSRAEREQLAADLRLLSTREDDTIQLLGDRINQ